MGLNWLIRIEKHLYASKNEALNKGDWEWRENLRDALDTVCCLIDDLND